MTLVAFTLPDFDSDNIAVHSHGTHIRITLYAGQEFFSSDAVGVVSPEVSFRRKNISYILNSDWKLVLWCSMVILLVIQCLLIQHEGKSIRQILPAILAENNKFNWCIWLHHKYMFLSFQKWLTVDRCCKSWPLRLMADIFTDRERSTTER